LEVVSVEGKSNLRAASNHASSDDHDPNIRGVLGSISTLGTTQPRRMRGAIMQAAGVVEAGKPRQLRDSCETVSPGGGLAAGERGCYGVDAMTPK
jgi:hypothetical protein